MKKNLDVLMVFDSAGPPPANQDFTEEFKTLDFEAEDAAYVSPILHVTPDDPPTLLVHGDKDDLVPILTSETIHAAFNENEVTTEFITIPGAGHGFRGEDAEVAMQAVIEWFDEHLGD